MIATPEFSRVLTLDAARRQREPLTIAADANECAALARRFDLIALDSLTATFTIEVCGEEIRLDGVLTAHAVQRCVATDRPVSALLHEKVHLRCVPASATAADSEAEVELSDADCDIIDYDGAVIDVGEMTAQSLALALDPWPRSPDADEALRAAGVKSEAEAGAFGALAVLRDKLGT
jgi:uncharacterized metal-binding protein YceD (DUF177 family)